MANKTGFIYEIINTTNGRKFIGSYWGNETDLVQCNNRELLRDLSSGNQFTKVIVKRFSSKQAMAEAETKLLLSVSAKTNPVYYNRNNSTRVNGVVATQQDRTVCPYCKKRPVAVNYHYAGIIYYRPKCADCYKKGVKKILPPGWVRAGYTKKDRCEKCHRAVLHTEASEVYHVNGNKDDNDWANLKTICLVCVVDIAHSTLPWAPSNITPDF